MRYFEIEDKEKKKTRVIVANEILVLMEQLESFNGTTKDKIYDSYYEIKRNIRDVIIAEEEKTKEVNKK